MDQYSAYSEAYEKVSNYIKKQGYSYTIAKILETYRNYYKKGFYVSYTAKDCIENFKSEFLVLDELHR